MKTIKFKINGLLMGLSFNKDTDIEANMEEFLKKEVNSIENDFQCKVVNDGFVDSLMETAIPEDMLDVDEIERHVAYEFEIEKSIDKSLDDNKIREIIYSMDVLTENNLVRRSGAINTDFDDSCKEDIIESYEYEIL